MKHGINAQQVTVGTGTGDLALAAAETGYRRLRDAVTPKPSGFDIGSDWFPYYIEDTDAVNWEFGTAQVSDVGDGTLLRSSAVVFESSNADALVDFPAGNKTVRIINEPNIGKYDRGVRCLISTPQLISTNGGAVAWESDTNDTDNCWTVGDADFIYVPLWADEIMVTVDMNFNTDTGNNATPVLFTLESFQFIDPNLMRFGGANLDVGINERATMQYNLVVDRSQVSGNPVNDGDRCSFRIRGYDPAGARSLIDGTRLRIRVVR